MQPELMSQLNGGGNRHKRWLGIDTCLDEDCKAEEHLQTSQILDSIYHVAHKRLSVADENIGIPSLRELLQRCAALYGQGQYDVDRRLSRGVVDAAVGIPLEEHLHEAGSVEKGNNGVQVGEVVFDQGKYIAQWWERVVGDGRTWRRGLNVPDMFDGVVDQRWATLAFPFRGHEFTSLVPALPCQTMVRNQQACARKSTMTNAPCLLQLLLPLFYEWCVQALLAVHGAVAAIGSCAIAADPLDVAQVAGLDIVSWLVV